MTKYVENVNAYLSQMKIKQTYISLKTGMEKNKLSRILTGKQKKVDTNDMELIANALGYKMEFFLAEDFAVPNVIDVSTAEFAFYAGEPTKQQQEFAMKLIDLIENVDEVLGAKDRYMNAIME
ncbi:MAG: hypothetical protein IJN92_00010 [Lachnospiraceae bacterium]|nr:hypothetical protein [Lachnospiraceae bacterium]